MALNIAGTSKVSFANDAATIVNVPGATVCSWIRLTELTANSTAFGISRGDNTASPRLDFFPIASDAIHMAFIGRALDTDTSSSFVTTTLAPSVLDWHFVACSIDFVNRIAKIYLDNSSETSATLTNMTSGNCGAVNPKRTILGNHDAGTTPLHGFMDDARIYNRLLTDGEIKTIKACQGRDNILNGLQARFKFNNFISSHVTAAAEAVFEEQQKFTCTAAAGAEYKETYLHYRKPQ